MKLSLKHAALVGLTCALAGSSQAQTMQWSTPLPASTAGGKLVLGGGKLWVTTQLQSQGSNVLYQGSSTASIYQVSESGVLNGSLTFSASTFGANSLEVYDITADSSGNAYVLLGLSLNGGLIDNFSIVKVNTSVSQVWASGFVPVSSIPVQIQLGSSNNPFVSAYVGTINVNTDYKVTYGAIYSFASDGTLNAGQPFEFPLDASAILSGLAVINANGTYPDEPYASGYDGGPYGNPNFPEQAYGGFLACPLFSKNPAWGPKLQGTFDNTIYTAGASQLLTLATDNKYVYAAGTVAFPYLGSAAFSWPLWITYGADGNYPLNDIWNRGFISIADTYTPGANVPGFYISPSQIAIDNEHDVLVGSYFTALNGTGQNIGMLVTCQSDVTGIGKAQQVIRSDSVGLVSYPNGCAGLGASVGKGVAWALGESGSNALFKFADTASTFAYLGAASPPTNLDVNTDLPTYHGLAVNASTGEAYVLGNGYISDYK